MLLRSTTNNLRLVPQYLLSPDSVQRNGRHSRDAVRPSHSYPLGAATPVTPQEPSPYLPSSRRFKSLLYLSIDEVPGAGALGPELAALAEPARRLNAERRIDRDAVFRAKRAALQRIWAQSPDTTALRAYRADAGDALEQFATFCALAEQYGAGWRTSSSTGRQRRSRTWSSSRMTITTRPGSCRSSSPGATGPSSRWSFSIPLSRTVPHANWSASDRILNERVAG